MMIGGFVVISVLILMASLVIFGSGKFFKDTETFVLYFDGSVKGLNVGAPVLFQGVHIGSVTSIVIRRYDKGNTARIPVTIEIEPEKFEMGDKFSIRRNPEESVPELIDLGLRAVLTMQSLITGQLMIECDFYPNSPVVYRDIEKQYLEIPTIRSATERLAKSFQDFNVEELQEALMSILTGLDKLVNSREIPDTIASFKATSDKLQTLVQQVETRIPLLANDLDGTLQDTRKLVNNINSQVDPLAGQLNKTVAGYGVLARRAEKQLDTLSTNLNAVLVSAKGVISEDAPTMVELKTTLQEISNAARAIKQLSEYLEQHPETLIQGKQGDQK